MMEQYYNTEQCPIQHVNLICKRHHPLQSNTESYSCGLLLRERKKVKVPSKNPFFASISSNFVLQNLTSYKMLNMITIRIMKVEYIWL